MKKMPSGNATHTFRCAACKKICIVTQPAETWAYKSPKGRSVNYYCSWTCFRTWQVPYLEHRNRNICIEEEKPAVTDMGIKKSMHGKTESYSLYYNGEWYSTADAARHLCTNRGVILKRIKLGWDAQKIMSTPVHQYTKGEKNGKTIIKDNRGAIDRNSNSDNWNRSNCRLSG